MAEAKIEIVEKQVVTTVEEEVVVLTLTKDEAETVKAVLAKVGGDPHTTRRGLIETVLVALSRAGIEYDTSDIRKDDSLYFLKTTNC